MMLNKFIFFIFLLLFNHRVTSSEATNFPDHEEQILMEEDLLLVKSNKHEPILRVNQRALISDATTTLELGSGSPDYTTTYFNSTISSITNEFTTELTTQEPFTFYSTNSNDISTSEPDFTSETTDFTTEQNETDTTEFTSLEPFTFYSTESNGSATTNSFNFTTTNIVSSETTQGENTTEFTSLEPFTFYSTESNGSATTNSFNFTTTNIVSSETTEGENTTQFTSLETFTTFTIYSTNVTTQTSFTLFETTVKTSEASTNLQTSARLIITSDGTDYLSSFFTSSQSTTSITSIPLTTENPTTVSTVAITSTNPTTATTTSLPGLLVGASDKSLVSSWNGIESYSSYFINLADDQVPLNVLGQSFSTLAIHPNGFVSLGSAIFNVQYPTSSADFSIPIISPFWFSSVFSAKDSDITYGRYDSINMDPALEANVISLINNRFNARTLVKTRKARGIIRSSVTKIDIIYVFTWKNLHFYNANSDQTATFQLILATTVDDEHTYALFKYPQNGINWNYNDVVVFIGYTSGLKNSDSVVNFYSNAKNKKAFPSQIDDQVGNTNAYGLFIYDLKYGPITDLCTSWYNKEKAGSKASNFKKENFVDCPTLVNGAKKHPLYKLYTGKIWQSNSVCFFLNTKVYYEKKYQQFCCYDSTFGTLNVEGTRAGFVYNSKSLTDIITNGLLCCADGDLNLCRKFYKLYPPSIITRSQDYKQAGGVGDPQLTTFDGLTYSFDGFGKFLLSQANDDSYKIQSETKLFTNVNDPSIVGTIFNGFALKTSDSMTFEIRLNDNNQNAPFIEIYVNQSSQALNILDPTDFYKDYNCVTNSSIICNSIYLSDSKNAQMVFRNGLSINFQIISIEANQFQTVSIMSTTIALISPDVIYTSNVKGLMGNNDENQSNDISSRSGAIATDFSKDSSIYEYAQTWKLISSDENLFLNSSSRKVRQSAAFTPTFLDQIIAKNLTLANQVNISCNYSLACVVGTLSSGIEALGQQTKRTLQENRDAIETIGLNPPSISFLNSSIKIDWSNLSPITIIANAFSYDKNTISSSSLKYNVQNANNWNKVANFVNSSFAIITITYTPVAGEYPIFEITVTDSKNLAATSTQSEVLICNCKSLDQDNTCLYENIQLTINPFVRLVSCKCNEFYSGKYCNETIDYCKLGDWCKLYPGFNENIACSSYSVSLQKSTGFKYECKGNCSGGFNKNSFGACLDIDECLISNTTCPENSTCANQIGGFNCICNFGYIYKAKQCQFIDYCKTSQNTCDSICKSKPGGFDCDCYEGYSFNQTTNKCELNQTAYLLSGCSTYNCSQICSNKQCFCFKGYTLNSADNKKCDDINECLINNGNCSNGCSNTNGSFTCTCPKGNTLDVDFQSCIACEFGKYGDNCSQTCSCSNAISCDPVQGCICELGYEGVDCDSIIDLCKNLSILFDNTTTKCESFPGYYQLTCLSGYEKTSSTNNNCTKINYCKTNLCPNNSTCTSLDTKYTCNCSPGYTYSESQNNCVDINECLNTNSCATNTTCLNLPGSYYCACQKGYKDLYSNITYNPNPICIDINECLLNVVCSANQTCLNTNGSYLCLCPNGKETLNGECDLSVQTTTTQTTPVAVGLILSIVLPIGIVLILSLLASLVVYFWFKIRAENLNKLNQKKSDKNKDNLNNLGSKWPLEKSMFQREDYDDEDLDSNYLNNFQQDYNDVLNGGNQNGIRSIYRPNYPFDDNMTRTDSDFFKSLEDKASSSQHTTIIRPQSIFSESSISLPTAYYETTTPYLKTSFPQFNNPLDEIQDEEQNEIFDNNDLDYDDDINDKNLEDIFDNDTDINDFVEAYNPNVKIPRPKLQFNPLNIFKLGPKPGESTE